MVKGNVFKFAPASSDATIDLDEVARMKRAMLEDLRGVSSVEQMEAWLKSQGSRPRYPEKHDEIRDLTGWVPSKLGGV